jgi:hypothetical protein
MILTLRFFFSELEADLHQMKENATRTDGDGDAAAEARSRPSFEPVQQKLADLQSVVHGYQEISGLSFEKAANGRLRYVKKVQP